MVHGVATNAAGFGRFDDDVSAQVRHRTREFPTALVFMGQRLVQGQFGAVDSFDRPLLRERLPVGGARAKGAVAALFFATSSRSLVVLRGGDYDPIPDPPSRHGFGQGDLASAF